MIFLYTLTNCPYSAAAMELVEKLNLPHEEIRVSEEEKNKYKKKHKMETFPQIFFQNSKGKMILLGGYSDFANIVEFCKGM